MAKGVGLDAGEFEIKVVELDGSYRKPRLAKVSVDRVSQPASTAAGDEAHAAREAEAAVAALKDANVSRDNVILGFPCRETVLRILDVPFKGAEQIRKVIKFEVEDSIHSHNVDDMVVDFHTLQELEGATRVLVAAVPKQPLRVTLRALEAMGIDPERVDLDTMALFRTAEWAGCLTAKSPGAETADEAAAPVAVPANAVAEKTKRLARVIVDIGGRSTRLVAALGTQIAEMRALRFGVDGVADAIAAAKGIGVPAARDAVYAVFETRQPYTVPAVESEVAATSDDAETTALVTASSAVAAPAAVVTLEEVEAAAGELLRRMHRELMRFVASMKSFDGFEVVYVTGGGSFLPGVHDVLREVFGCPTLPLPVLANLSHNLDEAEARWIEPRIAVAVGLALGSMGGIASLQFRQEDLAFQRRFDRIKFPLAIVCMLAVFFLFVFGMQKYYQVQAYAKDYGMIHEMQVVEAARGSPLNKVSFWGYVRNLMDEESGYSCATVLDKKSYQQLVDKLAEAETFDRLRIIHKHLEKYLSDKQRETGIYEDLLLPSGYLVLAQFANIVERVENELGSFVIMDMQLSMGAKDPYFEFKIAMRGPGFRARFDRLKSAIEAEFSNPSGSMFSGFAASQRGEDPYETPDLQGAIYTLKVEVRDIKP